MIVTAYRKGLFKTLDAVCILVALGVSSLVTLPPDLSVLDDYTGASLVTVAAYLFFFYVLDAYQVGAEDFRDSIARVLVAFVLGAATSATAFFAFQNWRFDRETLLLLFFLCLVFCVGWRYLYYRHIGRFVHRPRVLLVGADSTGKIRKTLAESMSDAEILGYLDVEEAPVIEPSAAGQGENDEIGAPIQYLGTPCDVMFQISRLNPTMVVLAPQASLDAAAAKELLQAKLRGHMVVDLRAFCEHMLHRLPVSQMSETWLLTEDGFSLNTRGSLRRLKRAADVAASLGLLVFTAPIILAVMLAIRLESPGPIIYSQRRVGLFGAVFAVHKLRSMRTDAEKNGAVWAGKNDSRVTRVGKFIRKTRIDELPQLWNVLRGDMSLIGPRPERPEFVEGLEKSIPFYSLRHTVKPGVTGWAQVCYPYGANEEDARRKLEYDLYYVKNISLLLDIRIALKTIGVVLFPKGAR